MLDCTEILGKTAISRATLALLEFNSPRRRELRKQLIDEGVISGED
jgi:hypothetical protein